jgi:hypothetical protein
MDQKGTEMCREEYILIFKKKVLTDENTILI